MLGRKHSIRAGHHAKRGLGGAVLAVVLGAALAHADGKVSLYTLRMDPSGQDAKQYSRGNWGGGLSATFAVPQVANLIAGTVGFEYVNLLSDDLAMQDPVTLLRVEQQTRQHYARLYLGPEFGPHGDGFLRPHAGANLAAVFYGIHTDVVVPDDVNRENEIRQNLKSENRVAMGYDVNAGLDLQVRGFSLDGGVRFLKSFNVPQQLGPGSVTIHPGYFQFYFGVGVSLWRMMKG